MDTNVGCCQKIRPSCLGKGLVSPYRQAVLSGHSEHFMTCLPCLLEVPLLQPSLRYLRRPTQILCRFRRSTIPMDVNAHQVACIICDQGLRSLLERIGPGAAGGPRPRAAAPRAGQRVVGRYNGGRAAARPSQNAAVQPRERARGRQRRGRQGGRSPAAPRFHGGDTLTTRRTLPSNQVKLSH